MMSLFDRWGRWVARPHGVSPAVREAQIRFKMSISKSINHSFYMKYWLTLIQSAYLWHNSHRLLVYQFPTNIRHHWPTWFEGVTLGTLQVTVVAYSDVSRLTGQFHHPSSIIPIWDIVDPQAVAFQLSILSFFIHFSWFLSYCILS